APATGSAWSDTVAEIEQPARPGSWPDVPLAQPVTSEIEDRIVVEPAVIDPNATLPADTVTELVPGAGDGPPTSRVVPAAEIAPMPIGTVPAPALEPEAHGSTVHIPTPAPVDPD